MEEEFIFFEFGKFRGIFRAVNLALKFDSFDIYGNIDRLFLTSDFSIPSLSKLLGFKWMEFFEFGKGGELLKFERSLFLIDTIFPFRLFKLLGFKWIVQGEGIYFERVETRERGCSNHRTTLKNRSCN